MLRLGIDVTRGVQKGACDELPVGVFQKHRS
jgi:hypothetical protein